MFLSDLRGQQVSHSQDAACAEHVPNPTHVGPDEQLIADCRSFMCQMSGLLSNIEDAADSNNEQQGLRHASLCQAEDQALDLMSRIVSTPAYTTCGVQSKHAVADFMLASDWPGEPSPDRDALLRSFILDAARLQYPAAADDASAHDDFDATTTAIVQANACLAVIKELAAGFAQKDQNPALGQSDSDDLDTTILGLKEQKESAIRALVGVQAYSASALHAKRIVLRRMLEAGAGDGDAHDLRIELARSYFSDLNTFFRTQERQPSPAVGSIWNTLTSRLRWLTSTVPHR